MERRKKTRLEAGGIEVEAVLARFLNNEALMLKFLLGFPQDQNYARLREALDTGDGEAGYRAAHTLKGVAGNLSMVGLYAAADAICRALRAGDLAAAEKKLPQLDCAYEQVIRALEEVK